MSLSEIIDRVQPWCPGWERSTGRKSLLAVAQQVLDSIFSLDHESLIFRPGNTLGNSGFPPYLITAAAEYKYPLDSSHLSCGSAIYHESSGNTVYFIPRKVRRILVDITNYGPYFDSGYGETVEYFGKDYSRTLFQTVKVSTTPSMTSNSGTYIPPTVTFVKDPGATTDKFFVEFYIMPDRLTSIDSEIPLPIQFERDFERGIRGVVQELESGSPSPMLQAFELDSMPKIRSEFISSATTRRTSTPPNYV